MDENQSLPQEVIDVIAMRLRGREPVGMKMLIGRVLVRAEASDADVEFEDTEGNIFRLEHRQDCCESVYVESVVGDLKDLVGSPILMAEEVENMEEQGPLAEGEMSYTWTFYKLATRKGYVDIRFYGTSNGYYSETVDFNHIERNDA